MTSSPPAKVTTSVSTLTAAAMADHYEAQANAPYNSVATDILAAPNQITNYTSIAGLHGGTAVTRTTTPQAGGYDVGINPAVASFNGIPFRMIRGATTTELLWPNLNDITIAVQRDVTYKPMPDQADDTVGQVSFGALVILENRRLHSKMTGITA
jgi:hypothetical protein